MLAERIGSAQLLELSAAGAGLTEDVRGSDLPRVAALLAAHTGGQLEVALRFRNGPEDFPVVEFWKVLTGEEPGRRSAEEITLFDSVGFAIADFAALRCVRDLTAGTELQDSIELIADPQDPKDLFSLVGSLKPIS